MCSYPTNFNNFIGVLYLKKTNFFGVKNTIYVVITPTFKVVKIVSNHNSKIPIKKGETIHVENFSKWVIENNYSLDFSTKNSKFKRDLYFLFDDIILNSNVSKNSLLDNIIPYLKCLINFRIFIKK
jgi:hypothetical protein